MTDKPEKPAARAAFRKSLLPERETLIIRVFAPEASGDGYRAVSFEQSRVDYVTEISPGLSALALKSGAKIPVAMDYDALERRVYFTDPRDEPVLDLREATGPAAAEAVAPALATDFGATAPAPPEEPEVVPVAEEGFVNQTVTIAVFARQPQQQNFVMCVFDDTEVDWNSVRGPDGKNGPMTKLEFTSRYGPFDDDEIIFDLPRPVFMELYNKAKMEGKTQLDLRELTRRRDPDKRVEKLEKQGLRPGDGNGLFF